MSLLDALKPDDKAPAAHDKVRYAVVGLGHFAQSAVLPAFKHATENCELVALVSDDDEKLAEVSSLYGVKHTGHYDAFEHVLEKAEVDAVYIALPNSMHAEFTMRSAKAGVHVLCEKPMAVTSAECEAMIASARENNVRLMIAYRLHFEAANMKAVDIVNSGKIGKPRFFISTFSMQVKPGNIRVKRELGGGPLHDIGIYCINAARYLFQSEPTEVFASATQGDDERFAEVPEMVTAFMKFPDGRHATFTCSFGAASTSAYRVVGTEGDLRVEPAYEYAGALNHVLTVNEKESTETFPRRDQLAAELVEFADCIRSNREPEPSGEEGLADLLVIEAIEESIRTGRPVTLMPFGREQRPSLEQEMRKSPIKREPPLVNVEAAS